MNAAVIGILGSLGSVLLLAIVGWLKEAQARRQGGELEAGRASAVSAVVAQAEVQAVVNAPRTQEEVAAALDGGKF